MYIDCTGIILTPSKDGKDCLGNGENFDKKGKPIECCCDACEFFGICYKDGFKTVDGYFIINEEYWEKFK